MLHKGVAVEPTERRLQAFNDLKNFLTSAPVLAMPMDDGQYCIEEDGSSVGCGAVLSQLQADRWRVIEYARRSFNRAEIRN